MPRFLRAQAHSRHPQPDEGHALAHEVAAAELVDDDETFDAPPLDTVLQRDAEIPAGIVVPVRLVGSIPVPVDNVPLRLGGMGTLSVGTTPVRLVNEDARRGALVLACTGAARIARTQQEAQNSRTSFLLSSSYGPWRFHFVDELWVRGDAGTVNVSFLVESWAR